MKTFRLEKKGKRLELDLYGIVGDTLGDGIAPAKVVALLRNADGAEEIVVRINSAGGVATDGIAIMDALKAHPAKVTVKIDGIAASAASLIAMAGDTIEVGEGAFLMVHKPWGYAIGTDEDMLKVAEVLEKMEGEIVNVYARRSGKPVETVKEWVQNETWFTGAEAVAAGLADKAVDDPESTERAARAYAEHAGILNFAHLPEALKSLVEAHSKQGGENPPPKTQEGDPMKDLKTITSAELAEARPDLVEEIKSAAKQESAAAVEAAVNAERARASGIASKAAELNSAVDVAKFIAEGTPLADAWQEMLTAKQEELHAGAVAVSVGHGNEDGETDAKANPFVPKEG